jgi:hypothetical protein
MNHAESICDPTSKAVWSRGRQHVASTPGLVGLTCADDSILRFERPASMKAIGRQRFQRYSSNTATALQGTQFGPKTLRRQDS